MEPQGRLMRGFHSDHRENRPGEITSGFHQLICASSFKFVSGATTPQHTKTAHSNSMGPENVIPAVPTDISRPARLVRIVPDSDVRITTFN